MKIRNKLWIVLAVIMTLCLILAILDIWFVDISFIYGNGFGIIMCVISIIIDLINYFIN